MQKKWILKEKKLHKHTHKEGIAELQAPPKNRHKIHSDYPHPPP